jgi:2-dehydropantoate 2-reductase
MAGSFGGNRARKAPTKELMTSDLLIIGSGALATLFAARLSAAGVHVTMLGSWQAGLAALRKDGARLDGGDTQIVQATDSPADCRGAKYALVLVKSWQTEHSASQLAECLAEDGLAVTLQNGLGNDSILARSLGLQRVSRGVTTHGATLLAPGLVRPAGNGEITLEAHTRLNKLEEMLQSAGFELRITENMEPIVWGKLIINAAINPITALLRVKNGDLLTNPPAQALMSELAGEAARVAQAIPVELPFLDPARAAEEVAQRTAENISSMLQDVLRSAPTEVDAINGAIVRMGERKGVPAPANRAIYSLVKALSVRDKI